MPHISIDYYILVVSLIVRAGAASAGGRLSIWGLTKRRLHKERSPRCPESALDRFAKSKYAILKKATMTCINITVGPVLEKIELV